MVGVITLVTVFEHWKAGTAWRLAFEKHKSLISL